MSSCAESSKAQYDSALRRWHKFCISKSVIPFVKDINLVLEYLTLLYNSNLGYSTINTNRSALSLIIGPIDGFNVGSHPLVVRLLKGVGRSRPPLPRYNSTWNVDSVLELFKKWPNNEALSIKCLTLKLVGLLALISAQRVQTLHAIELSHIKSSSESVEIFITRNLKTSKVGCKQPCIILKRYSENVKLCVVSTLNEYLIRTSSYRKYDQLLLSLFSPFVGVSTQTISRWLSSLLEQAGVDTSIYTAHSFRHASTSKACKGGVPIDVIFACAGWTQRSSTFARYYNKRIDNRDTFADCVLKK